MIINAVSACHSRKLNVRQRVVLVLINVDAKGRFYTDSVPVSQTASSAVRRSVKNLVKITVQEDTTQTATMESVLSHALAVEETTIITIIMEATTIMEVVGSITM